MLDAEARADTVEAMNGFAARWAATCEGGESVVMAGPSAWPLLALLASAADGKGREELETAVGMDASLCLAGARVALRVTGASAAVKTAVGLWTRHGLPLREQWLASLPPGVHGELTGDQAADRRRLDAWAADRTGGLISRLPLTVTGAMPLVLASALAVRTTWRQPFDEGPATASSGPWAGRRYAALRRKTADVGQARVVQTPRGRLTVLRVEGSDGIDVLVVLGEEDRGAADVLAPAIGAAVRADAGVAVNEVAGGGPGVVVREVRSREPGDNLQVSVPRFTVRSQHDLLARPEVFGLAAVTDTSQGNFPGISPAPLAVSAAAQSALASFQARGFEAAAVTAVGMVAAAMLNTPYRTREFHVVVDKPFGFLNVDRASGLVLTAGWVASPAEWSETAGH
jgi:serine protease inhibitor